MQKKLVAITGAGGGVGSRLWPTLADTYDLRLNDRREFDGGDHETVVGDAGDPATAARICAGADAVVHLAVDPRPHAPWDSLLPNNIAATYTLLDAAADAGVRRVVFASSIHASLNFPPGVQIREDMTARPGNLYGASKLAGEAIASAMWSGRGLSTVCLRIGWNHANPVDTHQAHMLAMYLSPRDLNALFALAIGAGDVGFAVVNALSNNRFPRLSLDRARELLGYDPQDDAFAGLGLER